MDPEPEVYHPAVSAISRGSSKRDLAARAADRADEEFTWQKQDRAAQRALQERAAMISESENYLKMASEMARSEQVAKQNIQAADFLSRAKDLHVTDPNYEDSVAKLHAEFPRAAGHPAVEDYLKINEPARQMILHSQESGNAPGPAATLKHVAAGLLQPEDFVWTDPAKRPEIYNEDGSINHKQASWLASQRAGQGEGLKGEKADQLRNVEYIKIGSRLQQAGTLDDDENADAKILYQGALKAEAARLKGPSTEPTPSALPSKTPVPLSPEDQKALDWANAHPGDPKALKIKALHGQ